MKEIYKIFSEKLYNHKTPPPIELWVQLDKALDADQRKRRKIIYWRVAAAVMIFFLAGGSWWFIGMESDPGIANLEETKVIESNETKEIGPEVNEDMNFSDDYLALEKLPSADSETTEAKNKKSFPGSESKSPIDYQLPKNQQSEVAGLANNIEPKAGQADSKVSELAVEKVLNPVERENIQRVEVEPLKPSANDLLALDEQVIDIRPTVTIIYKPGSSELPKENLPSKESPLELLADIKNSSINFSEIRNAKSELLAKVFNKLENEVNR